MLYNKIKVTELMGMFPFFIHQQVLLPANAPGKLFYTIDAGYWYWLRNILCKYPEVDAAGVAFIPDMQIEIRGSSRHRSYQDNPISLRLISSPGGNGVQIAAGGQLTATGPTAKKMFDEVFPQRDNITMYLTGHNATPFPAFIEICLVGYMIPDNKMIQFRGTNA